MISKDKKDLVVTCRCDCGDGIHLRIEKDGDDYAYQCFTNGNFYKEQDGMFRTLKNKLKKYGQLSVIKTIIIPTL